jgi:ArsR family transcriptional regulator
MTDSKLREEINHLHAHICSGLADPVRILILYTLAEKPCHVNELAEQTGIPQPTISRHLKTLRERNMVTARRDGQYVYYHLGDKRIIEALDLMRAVMADGLKLRAQIAVAAAK